MRNNWYRRKLFLIFTSCVTILTEGVQINYVKVPLVVKNNSAKPVILDCNYSVRTNEKGIVVKWFLNSEIIYQWIPPSKPQALGSFKSTLDLNYKATNEAYSAYRAMKILNPTIAMAGSYKCMVTSYTDEDYSVKNMTVIEPERKLVAFYGEPHLSKINFTCYTSDVYPEPKLYFYKRRTNTEPYRNPLQGIEWNTMRHPDGKYSVFVIASANESELMPGTLFYCDLRIPGTGYVKLKPLLYYPSSLQGNNGVSISGLFSKWTLWTSTLLYFCMQYYLWNY